MRTQRPTPGHHSPQPVGPTAARAQSDHIGEHGNRQEHGTNWPCEAAPRGPSHSARDQAMPKSGRAGTVYGMGGSPRPVVPQERGSGAGPVSNRKGAGRQEVRYPLQSELTLGAYRSAVPCARAHATAIMHEWGLGFLAEKVELVVSEIVTNALQASGGLLEQGFKPPFIQLWLSADQGRVVVKVWDASNELPEQQQPGPEADHGRGLMLVQAMTEEYGTYRLEGGNGKIVWAVLGSADTPARHP